MNRGGCLCGAVRYRITGRLRPVVNCHCGQCRRFHGHYGAYAAALHESFTLERADGLAWYDSSEIARRGFCRVCGSSLFWEAKGGHIISIAAGTLDQPTGLQTIGHIFTRDLADYYRIDDGLERLPEGMATATTSSRLRFALDIPDEDVPVAGPERPQQKNGR